MLRFGVLVTVAASNLLAAPLAAQVGAPGYGAPIPMPGAPAPHAMVSAPYAPPAAGRQVWQDGRWVAMPPNSRPMMRGSPHRWGQRIDGRWYAGYQAPGGWKAYRRLRHGQRIPGYWNTPGFVIADYLTWGLAAPPYGYHWVRYYDDAVLIDSGGRVWDTVGGVSWDGEAVMESDSYSQSYQGAGAGYAPPPYAATPYAPAWGGSPPPVVFAPPAAQVQPLPPGYHGEYWSESGSSYAGSASYVADGTRVTVINLPGPAVTTTTTTTTEVINRDVTRYVRVRPHRPRRVVHCCVCACR